MANHNDLSAPKLGSVEMVELDRFICGLTSSELRQLNLDQFKLVPLHTPHLCSYYWHKDCLQRLSPCFRDAVDAVGSVQCSRPATRELRRLAESAFGDPSGWDEARVSVLGNIIGSIIFYLLNLFACI